MESPAEMAGLKSDDFLIKVNDINVVGERYNKTVALIKNESDKGRLRLEVIEPASYETIIIKSADNDAHLFEKYDVDKYLDPSM